jgi:hypothetical protein
MPSLVIHRLYGDCYRQLHPAGNKVASGLGDLLAAAPARRTSSNGPLFIRAALHREVAQQERGMNDHAMTVKFRSADA